MRAFDENVFIIPPSPPPLRCSTASLYARNSSAPSSAYGPDCGTLKPRVTEPPVGAFVYAAKGLVMKVGIAKPAPTVALVLISPRLVNFDIDFLPSSARKLPPRNFRQCHSDFFSLTQNVIIATTHC